MEENIVSATGLEYAAAERGELILKRSDKFDKDGRGSTGY